MIQWPPGLEAYKFTDHFEFIIRLIFKYLEKFGDQSRTHLDKSCLLINLSGRFGRLDISSYSTKVERTRILSLGDCLGQLLF